MKISLPQAIGMWNFDNQIIQTFTDQLLSAIYGSVSIFADRCFAE